MRETPATQSLFASPEAEKVIADLTQAVTIQNDSIRKLTDSVRILNNRVEGLEQGKPGRPCRACDGVGLVSGFLLGTSKRCPACGGKGVR